MALREALEVSHTREQGLERLRLTLEATVEERTAPSSARVAASRSPPFGAHYVIARQPCVVAS